MCIIIYRPSDHQLTLETLENCGHNNPDGWGFMYAQSGVVITQRGMRFADFLEVYQSLPADQELALHFRWQTHGDIDLDNTHPYSVLTEAEHGTDLWVMHNGIISIKQEFKQLSDTWHWVRDLVRPTLAVAPQLLEVKAYRTLLENTCEGSRLLFLDGDGNWTFLHATKWHAKEGCWFSNLYSHSPPKVEYYNWTKDKGDATAGMPVLTPSQLKDTIKRIADQRAAEDGTDRFHYSQDWGERGWEDGPLFDPANADDDARAYSFITDREAGLLLGEFFEELDEADADQLVFHHQMAVMQWFIDNNRDQEYDELCSTPYEMAHFLVEASKNQRRARLLAEAKASLSKRVLGSAAEQFKKLAGKIPLPGPTPLE